MNVSNKIIGFTLAELAFVLIYFIFPNFVYIQNRSGEEVQKLHNELDKTGSEIEILITENNSLKNRVKDLEKEELKSKILPSCIEKGLRKRYLFHTTITGENKYLIDNAEYSYPEILDRFKDDIDFARKNGCVQSISIQSQEGLDASSYIRALKRIQMTFYTLLL